MSEQPSNWREILNREWSKDFPTLSVNEIQKIIELAFYQLFLIEVDSIKIISDINSDGHYVKFEIEGEAFRDSANITSSELMENDGNDV
jgi:hypothetical protein